MVGCGNLRPRAKKTVLYLVLQYIRKRNSSIRSRNGIFQGEKKIPKNREEARKSSEIEPRGFLSWVRSRSVVLWWHISFDPLSALYESGSREVVLTGQSPCKSIQKLPRAFDKGGRHESSHWRPLYMMGSKVLKEIRQASVFLGNLG